MKSIDVAFLAEEGVEIPSYATPDSAGADIRAHLNEDMIIQPGEVAAVPTGIKVSIPSGYEIQVRPRSGLAINHQMTLINTPGTIDADYRGEVKILMINHGKTPFRVTPKMRIAQLIIAPVLQANFVPAESLELTARGAGGFGHTGLH